MDTDKIKFPKEFLQEAGRRNLMGCRTELVQGSHCPVGKEPCPQANHRQGKRHGQQKGIAHALHFSIEELRIDSDSNTGMIARSQTEMPIMAVDIARQVARCGRGRGSIALRFGLPAP